MYSFSMYPLDPVYPSAKSLLIPCVFQTKPHFTYSSMSIHTCVTACNPAYARKQVYFAAWFVTLYQA